MNNWVAAVQYASGEASKVKASCVNAKLPDVCALKELALQARNQASKRASYIVLPEYGTGQVDLYLTPTVGENPSTWPAQADDILQIFSVHAKWLNAYIIVNLLTADKTTTSCTTDSNCATGSLCHQGTCYKKFNTNVALDNTGKVVGVHRKFNLFGGETKSMTPGTEANTFSTPLGKMGMLICADIYGSTALNNKLGSTADVVLISSYWTTSNPIQNWYVPFLKKYSYYSVIANTTDSPGYGGGVFKPGGVVIEKKVSTTPSIAYGWIPSSP